MHKEIFAALRPLHWLSADHTKKRDWRRRMWQHLQEPFQKWFRERHPDAADEFQTDDTIDTMALYRVCGSVHQEVDYNPDVEKRPARQYAFF